MASLLDVSKGVFKSFKNSYPAGCTSLTLFRMVLFRAAHGWGGGGAKAFPPKNLSYISCTYETWHSYTLPKEDPTNIRIT